MDSSQAGPSNSFYNSRLESPIFDSPNTSSRNNLTMDDSSSDNGNDSKYINFSHSSEFGTNRDYTNSSDMEDSKNLLHFQSPPNHQRKKCILDLFPWLHEVTKINQKCLGSIVELKSKEILNAMDFLIDKLKEDFQEYYKSPKIANSLARYVRQFLYTYKHLYQSFELVSKFVRRYPKL